MGSFISAHSMFTGKNERNKQHEQNENRICFTCSKKIDDKSFVICVRCKIVLHNNCEETYGNKYYCVCPRCDKVGSLGTMYAPNDK
jgi:hypothetical protein